MGESDGDNLAIILSVIEGKSENQKIFIVNEGFIIFSFRHGL